MLFLKKSWVFKMQPLNLIFTHIHSFFLFSQMKSKVKYSSALLPLTESFMQVIQPAALSLKF